MKTYKLFDLTNIQVSDETQVLVRYEGYNDEEETHDVGTEAYHQVEGLDDSTELFERASFDNEAAALAYIAAFTEQMAIDFVKRNTPS